MFNPPDSEETIKRYAGIMTFVILTHYLLLSHPRPPLPLLLNNRQQNLIERFCHMLSLDTAPAPVLNSHLQDVLMSLLIHRFQGVQTHTTSDPVLMALVWHNLLQDGSFKPASQITQTFAAIQFLARSTALSEVVIKMQVENSHQVSDYYRCVFS